ncbi:exopolysaccharide biosynthesis protein [Pseudochelatococcus sp. G4_1912]|uniref:exopolysaccharide biosynthesis protein n=1 Tax=Pseudochelatococcus sp. G4_1912 TaxID=3114288 RepID=UPI0039C5DF07
MHFILRMFRACHPFICPHRAVVTEVNVLSSPFPRTSSVLIALGQAEGERLAVTEIVQALGPQAFAVLIVVLGLPNCLPMPPPIPLICGFLLFGVALQIVFGRTSPWIPKRLLNKSVARVDVARAVDQALPYVRRLEQWSRPRLAFFDTPFRMRLTGLALVLIATSLVTAAPIIGQIPPGIATCLVGLGLVERDGLVVICGMVIGAVGVSLSASFVLALVSGLTAFF